MGLIHRGKTVQVLYCKSLKRKERVISLVLDNVSVENNVDENTFYPFRYCNINKKYGKEIKL